MPDMITPFSPIVLTATGAVMAPITYHERSFQGQKENDYSPITAGGLHVVCNGHFKFRFESATHNRLVCSNCHLGITIPNTIFRMKGLREHFKQWNSVPQESSRPPENDENNEGEIARPIRKDGDDGND